MNLALLRNMKDQEVLDYLRTKNLTPMEAELASRLEYSHAGGAVRQEWPCSLDVMDNMTDEEWGIENAE